MIAFLNIQIDLSDIFWKLEVIDYYKKTVFEWKSLYLGAQDTICGGGRYDSLVEELGGKSCPAIGLSIGLERLILIMNQFEVDSNAPKNPTS